MRVDRCGGDGPTSGTRIEGSVAMGYRAGGATAASIALVAVLAAPLAAKPADESAAPPVAADPSEEATEEEVAVAELAALAQARADVASRMVASAGAEGARRRAEEAVVAAHGLVQVAEADLAHAEWLLDAALERLDAARAAQQAAQEVFDVNVATSYKFGGAQSTALLLTALQSAADAHDLARAVEELDNVLGHSYEELGRRVRATALADRRVERLTRLRGVAYLALQDAEAAIAPLVEAAARARATARSHEAALLDAAARALAAEEAALEAGAEPEDVAASGAGDPLAPGTAPVDDGGPTLDQRRAWLANRRAVLAGQARLPAEAWAVRRDLACPVAGASFGNDFHFPRSHGRRHLGTDVFAPSGSPIVALAAGEVVAVDPSDGFDGDHDLGGISVTVSTDVGRFYAAHLLRIAEGITAGSHVEAGQVVGYVGTTGNARGTAPHLHLGWYVDDVAVNPWPTLAVVCGADEVA
jgi:murein DD-endopeptidase MepM/ murein hydrolase activator NlpD